MKTPNRNNFNPSSGLAYENTGQTPMIYQIKCYDLNHPLFSPELIIINFCIQNKYSDL